MEVTITHEDTEYTANLKDGEVTIYAGWELAGKGTFNEHGSIEDCSANIPEEVYTKLEEGLCSYECADDCNRWTIHAPTIEAALDIAAADVEGDLRDNNISCCQTITVWSSTGYGDAISREVEV